MDIVMNIAQSDLAIHGGPKVRNRPMPYRRQFGPAELEMVTRVFHESWDKGVDFSFQGEWERRYTDSFCAFQGGGFADAVCTGTAAVYLALQGLGIEPGSEVIVSPVTDAGSISAVIQQGYRMRIADAEPDSFNIGPEQFEAALTDRTRAAVLTHMGGIPLDIEPIRQIALKRGILLVEDCSQAHGACIRGKRVGRFGQTAAFSTMFSKAHSTGGCGGLIFTEDPDLYWKMRSLADRGKPFRKPDYDPKDPRWNLHPALNFNLDELSCAIGLSTLSRLEDTICRRIDIIERINEGLVSSTVVQPCRWRPEVVPSPFFHTLRVDTDRLRVSKEQFARAVAAEGININPHYKFVVAEWPWIQPYLNGPAHTPNATAFRDQTFNILFHERFEERDIDDILESIRKVETVYADA